MISEKLLGELLVATRDGDWGLDSPNNGFAPFRVIRGADFPDVRSGDVTTTPLRFLDEKTVSRRTLQHQDILIETAGGTRDRPTGRTLFITEKLLRKYDYPVTCASFARFLRINTSLAEPEYVFWYLQYLYTIGAMWEHQVQHTGVARFQYTKFADSVKIPLPSMHEQRAIAGILGALDDKIELNRRMNTTLEAMAQGVFRQWFVESEDVGNWKIGIISDYAQVTSGKRPESRQDEADAEYKYPLIGGGGVMAYTDRFLYDFPILLTGRVGTLGIVFRIPNPCWASDNTLVLIPSKPEYYPYLYFHLKQTDLKILNRGSTQPLLTQSDLQKIEMLLPPEKVVAEFHRVVSPMFAKVDANEQESRTLANLRDTLLPKLMRGEVGLKVVEKEL